MSACWVSVGAAPGAPAAAPLIAGDWSVTCAVYSPCTIVPTRVVAVKPFNLRPAHDGLRDGPGQVGRIWDIHRQYQRVSIPCRGSARILGRELPARWRFYRPINQAIEIVHGHEMAASFDAFGAKVSP